LYREIGLTDISALKMPLGIHWAYDACGVNNYDDCNYKHFDDKKEHKSYVVRANIDFEDIDWRQTFDFYIIAEFCESEISVERGAKFENVEYKLKSENNFKILPVKPNGKLNTSSIRKFG
jgi:hypothetical protein